MPAAAKTPERLPRVLIADDEPLYLRTTGELLRRAGYECECVSSGDEALNRLRAEPFDLVLSDLNMPGNQHLELLREHSSERPRVPLIVVTGAPTLPSAIESIRLGITDYLLKPVRYEDLLACVERALVSRSSENTKPPTYSERAADLATKFPRVIGQSPPMLDVLEIIDRVATTNTNVLVTGESGTGKEVIARTLHEHSHRCDGPFRVIDCTSIPESLFESVLFGHKNGAFTGAVKDQTGLLEQSDAGTAFLDELGELSAAGQAKLLRAVQERSFTPVGGDKSISVDTRFVCATNRDLEMEVNAGRFRQDLFYRLGVIHLELPPLRGRGEDVLLLAEHFVRTLCPPNRRVVGLADDARQALYDYSWPGNVRELRNVIERGLALSKGKQIEAADLPATMRQRRVEVCGKPEKVTDLPTAMPVSARQSRDEALESAERDYLLGLLREHRGNVSHAARQAGLSRQGLHKLLTRHGLRAADYRG